MSKENVKLFYEALAKDRTLQDRFVAINQKYKGRDLDEDQMRLIFQKEMVPLGKKAGFDFTLAELQEYAREAEKPTLQELSEDELAAVAGGTCDTYSGSNCSTLPGFSICCPDAGITCPNPGMIPGT